jgi:hypothetical protein
VENAELMTFVDTVSRVLKMVYDTQNHCFFFVYVLRSEL